MNLNEILKQHDPAREADDADVAGLRQSIVTSPRRPPRTARRTVLAFALLLAVIAAVIAAVVSLRHDEPQRPAPIVRKAPLVQRPETRQLQLTTPGGTQLIWVFNDSL